MTVASMPMWSPVTRSPPLAEIATPRKRLPPPMTTAISVPARATSAISRGEAGQRAVVDAEGQIPQQRLARQFEQDPLGLGPRGHDRPRTFRRERRRAVRIRQGRRQVTPAPR